MQERRASLAGGSEGEGVTDDHPSLIEVAVETAPLLGRMQTQVGFVREYDPPASN